MRIARRWRLLPGALLCGGYLIAWAVSLIADRDDGWPVSIYPMYSEPRSATFRMVAVYGVAGPEEPVRSASLYPITVGRLQTLLPELTPPERDRVLRFVLARNPRYSAVRAYEEEWPARGGAMIGRVLLGEAVPPNSP